jgi:hypothetical protein
VHPEDVFDRICIDIFLNATHILPIFILERVAATKKDKYD